MKNKLSFISIFTLCIALSLMACNEKTAADTEKPQDTQTESGTGAADASSSLLNDLYQQENQLFAEHKDVWNKDCRIFGVYRRSLLAAGVYGLILFLFLRKLYGFRR